MNHRILTTLAVVTLFACGKPATGTKPTSTKVSTAAKSNASALKTSKPTDAMKTMQSPKPLPAAKSAGATTVKPPDPTKGGTVEVSTWAFTGVDLDGSGNGNDGVIIADDQNLLAFFNGSYQSDSGSGSYDALVWVEGESSVGFVFDFGAQGAIACGANATGSSGCVVCDANGASTEGGTGASQ